MSLFFSALQLVIRRSLANWKLLSFVIIGVVVAVALVSSTPLYSNTLSDLGLMRALADRRAESLDIQVYAPNYAVNIEEYAENQAFIRSQVYKSIGSIIRQEETPGLGGRIAESDFLGRFETKEVFPRLIIQSPGKASGNNEIDGITGATLSCKAFEEILNSEIKKYVSIIKENK